MGAQVCCCNQEAPCEHQAKGLLPGAFPAADPNPAGNEYEDELVDSTRFAGGTTVPSSQAESSGCAASGSAAGPPDLSTPRSVVAAAKEPAAAATKASAAAAVATGAGAHLDPADVAHAPPPAASPQESAAETPAAKETAEDAPKAVAKAKVKPKAKPKEKPKDSEAVVLDADATREPKEDPAAKAASDALYQKEMEVFDKAAQESFARVGLDRPEAKIQVLLDIGWVDAGTEEHKQIKDNCATGSRKFAIQVRGSMYVVDMTDTENMFQTNPSSGKMRKLRIV